MVRIFFMQRERVDVILTSLRKKTQFASASSQKTSGKNLNYQPFYSPAIDKIVFRCQNEGSSTSDIFMMAATNGKTLTQITESSNAYEGNPCISSDGKLLVYDKVAYSYARSMNLGSLLFGLGSNITIIENSEICCLLYTSPSPRDA